MKTHNWHLFCAQSVQQHLSRRYRPGGILIVQCGGGAGLFSAMIGGWANGELGSQPVTQEIGT